MIGIEKMGYSIVFLYFFSIFSAFSPLIRANERILVSVDGPPSVQRGRPDGARSGIERTIAIPEPSGSICFHVLIILVICYA